VFWIRIRLGIKSKSGSGSAINKYQEPDPHPAPRQSDKSDPDPLPHPDTHRSDADPQHHTVVNCAVFMSEFGMCEELRRTRIYVHLEKNKKYFYTKRKGVVPS
jgi:hypothetical protein